MAQSQAFGGNNTGVIAESDPFLGDYEGLWIDRPGPLKHYPTIAAEVIPRGGGRYQINILPELGQRCPPFFQLTTAADGDTIKIDDGPWKATITPDIFTGQGEVKSESARFEMKKVIRLSPTLGAEPPDDALVLFDGSDFEQWRPAAGKYDGPINWELDGNLMRIRAARDEARHGLRTKRAFGDCRLHVEFRLPLEPENDGQGRANSGIYVGGYEVQVLDSYGLPGYYNECGGLYKRAAPMVNMCAPPLLWQTYDITFHAAHSNKDGKVNRNPRITVLHNGVVIHNDYEILPLVSRVVGERAKVPSSEPVAILLQNHGHPIEYRNIWVVELGDK